MSRANRRVLLPFSDDSTLFFAQRMKEVLEGSGLVPDMAWLAARSDISARQLTASLPEGPDVLLRAEAFKEPEVLGGYDAILTCRLFPALRDMLRNPMIRHRADRPAVLAFQGGLDFDPTRGFFNRRFADAVFVTPRADVAAYRAWEEGAGLGGVQYVGFGHPTFLQPKPRDDDAQKDVYFFAQAISPLTYRARMHIVEVLALLARAYPDRTVWLKLRHLPGENAAHLHKELFPYPDLLKEAGADDLPNLKLTAEPMEAILPHVGIGITCTSTAAIDLVRAGVPAMVYLDYVESYLDPLVEPMRERFAASGLITGLEDVLALNASPIDPNWESEVFVERSELVAQISDAIEHFHRRADLVRRVLPDLARAG